MDEDFDRSRLAAREGRDEGRPEGRDDDSGSLFGKLERDLDG